MESKFLIPNKKQEDVRYFMGTDTYDDISTYCLCMKSENVVTVILSKQFKTDNDVAKKEFEKEVNNLCKYFSVKHLF